MHPDPSLSAKPRSHWQRARRLTAFLLLSWFALTFGVIFFARELSSVTLFGWPLSFYMAAQGSILVYLAIVVIYAWRMHRLDQTFSEDKDAA
jgi:putative solute:sodium symporter small subunit